jgi:hypothetical protein
MYKKMIEPFIRQHEKSLILNGKILSDCNRLKRTVNRISDAEFSVFSQWGEDGIINWLLSNLPDISPSFIEFGVEDYTEANTRFLLHQNHWKGFVIDGSPRNIARIRGKDFFWRHHLKAESHFINVENINSIIEDGGFAGDLGVLSIDIDGNDYWVWRAIEAVNPAIVIIEYNAVFGDQFAVTVPYERDFERNRGHYSNLYFGASLPALRSLGRQKGYTFIGTTKSGVNAFFVRDDIFSSLRNKISCICSHVSSVRESRNEKGQLSFFSGVDRASVVSRLKLVDVDSSEVTSLIELGDIYSPEWKMGDVRLEHFEL